MSAVIMNVTAQPFLADDAVNENDLTICNACCCGSSALYTDCPECIGCSGKGSVCWYVRDLSLCACAHHAVFASCAQPAN